MKSPWPYSVESRMPKNSFCCVFSHCNMAFRILSPSKGFCRQQLRFMAGEVPPTALPELSLRHLTAIGAGLLTVGYICRDGIKFNAFETNTARDLNEIKTTLRNEVDVQLAAIGKKIDQSTEEKKLSKEVRGLNPFQVGVFFCFVSVFCCYFVCVCLCV